MHIIEIVGLVFHRPGKKIDSISLGFVLCTTQADTLPAWPWLTASTEHSQNKTTADRLPCDGSRA